MKKGWHNLTPLARPLYRAAFNGEPWPTGWKVYSIPFMRCCAGLCKYSAQEILINRADHKTKVVKFKVGQRKGQVAYRREGLNILRTLIHEFVHMRCGRSLRHGKEFEALVEAAYTRIWQA